MTARPRGSAGAWSSAALVGAVMFYGSAARGQTPPRSIELFVAGRSDTVAQLQSAVRAGERPMHWVSIDQIDVADVVRRPTENGPQATRAWIDCSRGDRVRIYFVNWNTERFLVREVLLPQGLNELALEILGQVIETSLSALIADNGTGMSRAEIASVLNTTPSATPATSETSVWGVTWGAFYAVQVFAPEQLIEQGPGLIAALGQREGRWRPGGWISAQYQLPETIETDLIGVRLDTFALRAGAELARELTARVALAVHMGIGIDVVHIAPRQGSTQHASLSPERFSSEYATQLALVGTTRLGARVVLSAAILADADLGTRHYDVIVDGSMVRVLTPWRVRPGIMAGITWQ